MKELFKLPKHTVVKVTFRYPWRKEPEQEVIGIINQVDTLMVLLDYPAALVDKDKRELNINESPKKMRAVAKTLAVYHSYEYTVKPVSAEEVDEWYNAANAFHMGATIDAIKNKGAQSIKRIDIPENVLAYIGETFEHQEVK